jgi:hypothetical protein
MIYLGGGGYENVISKHFSVQFSEKTLLCFKVSRLRPIVTLITALLRSIGCSGKMLLTWKTQISAPRCPLRYLHAFAWDQTHAFAIRGRCIAT